MTVTKTTVIMRSKSNPRVIVSNQNISKTKQDRKVISNETNLIIIAIPV